jgi:hypothetical protein
MSNENELNCEISLESLKSSDFDSSSEIDKSDDESESISSQKIWTHEKFSYSVIITGEDKMLSESAVQGIPHDIIEAKKICNKWYELFETNQIDLSVNHKVEVEIQNLKLERKYKKRAEKEKSEETQNVKKSLQKSRNKSQRFQ